MSSAGPRAAVAMLLSNPATYDARPLKEAHSLASRGYRVTILAWDREKATRTDSVFSDGVTIKRFRLFARHGTPFLTVPKLFVFYIWCFVQLAASKFQVLHCHDVDTLPIGLTAKALRLKGMKLVYDMHDLPEAFLRFFPLSQTLQRAFLAVCRKEANLVVSASEGYTHFLTASGYSPARVAVVLNAPSLREGRSRRTREGEFRVLYYGGMEEERGVRFLVEAVAGLQDVTLTLAGRGSLSPWLVAVQRSNAVVKFVGWRTTKELDFLIRDASLIPSFYAPVTANIRLSTPGKLLTCLSLSIPVLVPAGSHQEALVKAYGCGIAIKWGSAHEVRDAIARLAGDPLLYEGMAESAYRAFQLHLNWEAMEARLAEAYGRLVPVKQRKT